jgi:RNA polymerase sigma factor (sigma-70 family)
VTTEPFDERQLECLLRELSPDVLAALMRRFKDFGAAEDAVQEALLAAASQWPSAGLPQNPRAWLIQVAARRMTDHVRAELARRRRETFVVMQAEDAEERTPSPDEGTEASRDDTLLLLFMCCHPALTRPSAIALTLRAVGGLTSAEIASAFLVPEATMAQRISRAKQSIKSSSVPFSMPSESERDERLTAVLHVLYLIFNEGYASSSGSLLQRVDLANEAIRLTRGLHALLPDHPEATGLLALMLLTDARRAARTGKEGELIPLDLQDRSLFDRDNIDEGVALLTRVLPRGQPGPFQIQAAIAAVHDEAARAEDTDWAQILALYDVLAQLSDNPMVMLNRAVAAAMVHGPAHGLALIAALEQDARLSGHYRVDAVRGHLHERAGEREAALRHYRAAAARTASTPERNYLLERAARLRAEDS